MCTKIRWYQETPPRLIASVTQRLYRSTALYNCYANEQIRVNYAAYLNTRFRLVSYGIPRSVMSVLLLAFCVKLLVCSSVINEIMYSKSVIMSAVHYEDCPLELT